LKSKGFVKTPSGGIKSTEITGYKARCKEEKLCLGKFLHWITSPTPVFQPPELFAEYLTDFTDCSPSRLQLLFE